MQVPERLTVPTCIGCGAMTEFGTCDTGCSEHKLELVRAAAHDASAVLGSSAHARAEAIRSDCRGARMASASWRGLGGRLPGAPGQGTGKPATLPKRPWAGHRVRGASRAGYNVVVRRVRGDRRAATVPGNMHLAIRRMGESCCLRAPAGAFSRRASSGASPSRADASRHVGHSPGRPVGARLASPSSRGAESAEPLKAARTRLIRPVNEILYPLKPDAVGLPPNYPDGSKFHALSRTLSSGAVDVNDEDGAVGLGVEDFVADAAQQE